MRILAIDPGVVGVGYAGGTEKSVLPEFSGVVWGREQDKELEPPERRRLMVRRTLRVPEIAATLDGRKGRLVVVVEDIRSKAPRMKWASLRDSAMVTAVFQHEMAERRHVQLVTPPAATWRRGRKAEAVKADLETLCGYSLTDHQWDAIGMFVWYRTEGIER